MLGMSAAETPPAGSGLCAGIAPALLCCSTPTMAAETGSFPAHVAGLISVRTSHVSEQCDTASSV